MFWKIAPPKREKTQKIYRGKNKKLAIKEKHDTICMVGYYAH
jgi:hypothetical protein